MLNLGCGVNWNLYPEFEGLDIIDFGQTYQADARIFLQSARPEEWDVVMANHFFEHFDQVDLRLMFFHIHRVVKVGGLLKFVVPSMKKDEAWVLSHKTFWNEATVRWLEREDADIVYGFGKWKVEEVITNSREDIHARLIKI